jgi:hypothetical protein
MTPPRLRSWRVTAAATHPLTGQGDIESVEIRAFDRHSARKRGIRQLRDDGWEVDTGSATVIEVVPVVGLGTPGQRMRTLREILGEDRRTFAGRFLVPATGTHVLRWEQGRPLRPFELETLAHLERALFGRTQAPRARHA